MITLPSIHAKINTQVLPAFMYVKPDHRVVVRRSEKGNRHDKLVLGMTIPLTENAAKNYAKTLTGGNYGVIQRKTAIERELSY